MSTCRQPFKASHALLELPAEEHALVLFCGQDMHYGFVFTKEALAGDAGVQVVQCGREQLAEAIRDADVAVPLMSRLDATLLRSAPHLKLIIQYGVGVEGIDIPTATELGIWVANIPSAGTGNAISCAEHAIYLMMATLRSHSAMADSIRTRQLGVPLGQTLYGKTVLIVGFGNIAKELVVRLAPFGMRVTALRRKPWCIQRGGRQHHEAQQQQQQQQQPPQQQQPQQLEAAAHSRQPGPQLEAAAEAVLADWGCWPHDSARLAAQADIVTLTCHQDENNRGMIDAQFLSHCKPGVRIINVARGGLLDYDAVRRGLASGHIAGLGLDVQPQEPVDPGCWLASHPQIYLTPHIAGVTEMSYRNMAGVVAAAVRRAQQGLPPSRPLNAPPRPRSAAADGLIGRA